MTRDQERRTTDRRRRRRALQNFAACETLEGRSLLSGFNPGFALAHTPHQAAQYGQAGASHAWRGHAARAGSAAGGLHGPRAGAWTSWGRNQAPTSPPVQTPSVATPITPVATPITPVATPITPVAGGSATAADSTTAATTRPASAPSGPDLLPFGHPGMTTGGDLNASNAPQGAPGGAGSNASGANGFDGPMGFGMGMGMGMGLPGFGSQAGGLGSNDQQGAPGDPASSVPGTSGAVAPGAPMALPFGPDMGLPGFGGPTDQAGGFGPNAQQGAPGGVASFAPDAGGMARGFGGGRSRGGFDGPMGGLGGGPFGGSAVPQGVPGMGGTSSGPGMSQGGFDGPMGGSGGGPFGGSFQAPAAVAQARQTLETDAKAALPTTSKAPSAASLDALRADEKAAHDGTLTGTDASTKLQADRDAVLAGTGLTADQVKSVDAAQTRFQADAAAVKAGTLAGDPAAKAFKTDRDDLMLAVGVAQDDVDKLDADLQALQDAEKAARDALTTTPKAANTASSTTGQAGQTAWNDAAPGNSPGGNGPTGWPSGPRFGRF